MNSMIKMTVISFLIVSMSGCSSMDKQDGGSVAGTVAGGVLGGVAGSAIGAGTGRLVATGAGAVVGALLGQGIGKSMQTKNQPYTQQIISTTDERECVSFYNLPENQTYLLRPAHWYVTSDNHICCEYNVVKVYKGNKPYKQPTESRHKKNRRF